MKKILMIFLLILSFAIPANAYSKPENISVSDYSGIISDSAKNYIKSKNDVLYKETKAKIIFVTVPSTDELSTENYCNKLYTDWQISSLGRNNSIFIVINSSKKEYDYVIGDNISLALTDVQLSEYIINDFEPYFNTKQYEKACLSLFNKIGKWYETNYNGLSLNLDENMDKYIGGETTPDREKPKSKMWIWLTISGTFVVLIIGFKIKHSIHVKLRKMEREKMRKKYKIDIDKIVNS